jgi:hypothetical protein
MAKLDSRNIYIESEGALRKFMNCKIEPNDGSFYVSFLRSGENSETVTFNSKDMELKNKVHDKPRKKLVRISYHSTGCVLYRNSEIGANYFEPITRLTQPNAFATWSIPAIKKLEIVTETEEQDFIISLPPNLGRIEFNIVLAPWNLEIEENHIAIRYEGILSLIIIPFQNGFIPPKELTEHFITVAPNTGLFEKQALPNDQALIEYHQQINNTRDLIIYSPNNEGVFKIITAVPMRIAPEVNIEFLDQQYKMELLSNKNNVVKFKVKDKNNHTVKHEVAIKSITLNSEL